MSKGMFLFLGVLSAGMIQFGILASVPGASLMIVAAGVVGAMGTALAGLLIKLPREEWSEQKREAKQAVIDAKQEVKTIETSEGNAS